MTEKNSGPQQRLVPRMETLQSQQNDTTVYMNFATEGYDLMEANQPALLNDQLEAVFEERDESYPQTQRTGQRSNANSRNRSKCTSADHSMVKPPTKTKQIETLPIIHH